MNDKALTVISRCDEVPSKGVHRITCRAHMQEEVWSDGEVVAVAALGVPASEREERMLTAEMVAILTPSRAQGNDENEVTE